MNWDFVAALETVLGRELILAEVDALEMVVAARDDVAVAEYLSGLLPAYLDSLTVEAVFDVLFQSGDYMTIKTAQLSGDPVAAMAFAVLADSKNLGGGRVNLALPATVSLLDALQASNLLSSTGRAALVARATVPAKSIPVSTVSRALNVAAGLQTIEDL